MSVGNVRNKERYTPFEVDRRYMNSEKKSSPFGLTRSGEVKCERSQTWH